MVKVKSKTCSCQLTGVNEREVFVKFSCDKDCFVKKSLKENLCVRLFCGRQRKIPKGRSRRFLRFAVKMC